MTLSLSAHADWFHHLPWILLSFRTTPADNTNSSPAQHVYGQPLQLPTQFEPANFQSPLPTSAFSSRTFFSPPPTIHNQATPPTPPPYVLTALHTASHVLICRDGISPPLSPLYDGPYQVLARTPTHFTVQIGPKKDTISIQRLKPAITTSSTPPAQPPR